MITKPLTVVSKIQNTNKFESDRITCVVYGNPGAGKTRLSSTIKEPTLILSAESGLLSIRGLGLDYWEINNFTDLREAYEYLQTEEAKKKYKWIYLDSLTEINERLLEIQKKKYPGANDTFKMWGEFKDILTAFIKSYRDFKPYNVVFTALASVDKDELGMRFTNVDINTKLSLALPKFFDEVFYLQVFNVDGVQTRKLLTSEYKNIIAKDRSGKLELYEEADLNLIKEKILGKKENANGNSKNNTSNA